ncbi:MAG: alkaline phosphatase D family protein [Chitinophagales bacterium]|nr:alkaline phosphatase D family protein [Chitinophagales bacterium]
MRIITCLIILVLTASNLQVFAQEYAGTKRLSIDSSLAPFYHGVASGDPQSDRVVIWTRVTTQTPGPISVKWYMATDINMSQVVDSGTVSTDDTKDYTVKVDVAGLQPATWYYYMFQAEGSFSMIGRTKTAPSGGASHLRFAVVSCSDYESGYFNVYKSIATRNDIDAVIHLGDYIYEYAASQTIPGRLAEPATEIIQLDDYRTRYSHYRLDPDLRLLHQQYPLIVTWDDHESANNSWSGGAENHTPGSEGDWNDRKSNAEQAYEEWLPLRLQDSTNAGKIFRKIRYGNLADIIVVDSRLYGRDEQGGTTNLDSNRTMLGLDQLDWFKTQLSDNTAKWKVVANQVMMAPLRAFGTPLNPDQWDGYPAERQKIYNHLKANNIDNMVVMTGDIHTSWANDLPDSNYVAATGANSAGVEYVVTSVTSSSGPAGGLSGISFQLINQNNPHIKYADLAKRGYVVLDLDEDKAQADWFYVSTITDTVFTVSNDASWHTNDGENHLTQSTAAAAGLTDNAPFAPQGPGSLGVGIEQPNNVIIIGAYPNPFNETLTLQYYVEQASSTNIKVFDLAGKKVFDDKLTPAQAGVNYTKINLAKLPQGTYVLTMENAGQQYRKQIVKVQ